MEDAIHNTMMNVVRLVYDSVYDKADDFMHNMDFTLKYYHKNTQDRHQEAPRYVIGIFITNIEHYMIFVTFCFCHDCRPKALLDNLATPSSVPDLGHFIVSM